MLVSHGTRSTVNKVALYVDMHERGVMTSLGPGLGEN